MTEWVFKFEAPAGGRILKRFWGVHAYPLWWGYAERRWLRPDERPAAGSGNTVHLHSFKAFKRHLRKHPELKMAEDVQLVSRWHGHNVTARLASRDISED